jgi:hypothetical protein
MRAASSDSSDGTYHHRMEGLAGARALPRENIFFFVLPFVSGACD